MDRFVAFGMLWAAFRGDKSSLGEDAVIVPSDAAGFQFEKTRTINDHASVSLHVTSPKTQVPLLILNCEKLEWYTSQWIERNLEMTPCNLWTILVATWR
jgi:hypothetical protein